MYRNKYFEAHTANTLSYEIDKWLKKQGVTAISIRDVSYMVEMRVNRMSNQPQTFFIGLVTYKQYIVADPVV